MLLLRLECLKIISIGAHAHTLLTLELLLLLTLMLTLTTGLISHDFISPEPLMLLSVVWLSLILRKEDEAQLVSFGAAADFVAAQPAQAGPIDTIPSMVSSKF